MPTGHLRVQLDNISGPADLKTSNFLTLPTPGWSVCSCACMHAQTHTQTQAHTEQSRCLAAWFTTQEQTTDRGAKGQK